MATPGWFNANANRAYPFVPPSVSQPGSGAVRNLPKAAVVDAGFVLGTGAGFDAATHEVRLARVRRAGDTLYFDFEATAPALFGAPVTFSRPVGSAGYVTEDADSDGEYGLSLTAPDDEVCRAPLWEGFLVTGDLSGLDLADGDSWEGGTGQGVLEPGLVQNLSGTYVSSVNLANDDRTRAEGPEGCPALSWPVAPDPLYVSAACLRGAVQFAPGYNAVIEQSDPDNLITVRAEVGAGAGRPCNEVPLYPGEAPPAGGTLLSGGPACGEVLRSVNGIGGRLFDFLAGLGFQVTPSPGSHEVTVDCNFTGLALCPTDVVGDSEIV